MRIFITGADGFIGQHLVERLQSKKRSGFHHKVPKHELEFLAHDLRDHQAVKDQLLHFDPQIIVHLAARTEVQDSFYEQVTFSDINYTGSVNLIESARECTNLKNFVFASTMEVYGWSPESDEIALGLDYTLPTFTPTTPVHPNAPYSVAKRGVELYLEYAQRSYDFNYIVDNNACEADTAFLTIEVLNCTSVNESTLHQSSIFPNPSHGFFNFLSNQKSAILIHELTGRLIKSIDYLDSNSPLEIDLKSFPKGTYVLIILTENKVEQQKIIIQ